MVFKNILKKYFCLLDTHPFIVQPITTSFIFTLGDILCQFLLRKFNNDGSQHDYIRTLRQGSAGLVLSPFQQLHFIVLIPRVFKHTKNYKIFKLLLWDALFLSIPFQYIYFSYVSLWRIGYIDWPAVISNQQTAFFTIVFTGFHLIILILLILVIIEELFS